MLLRICNLLASFRNPWLGRVGFILAMIAVFTVFEWRFTPHLIQEVSHTNIRINPHAYHSGNEGVAYGDNSSSLDCASTVTLVGWNGRIRWKAQLAQANADKILRHAKGVFSGGGHLEGEYRRVYLSADNHYLVQVTDGGTNLLLTTWRDGERTGESVLTDPLLFEEPWKFLQMVVLRNGNMLLVLWKKPKLHFFLLNRQGIYARGIYPINGVNDLRLNFIHERPVCFCHLDNGNVECISWQLAQQHSLIITKCYITADDTADLFISRFYQYELVDSLLTENGVFTVPPECHLFTASTDECALFQVLEDGGLQLRPSSLTVLDKATDEQWAIPYTGYVEFGHVTPDGRFAAIIGRTETRTHSLSNQELLVYERPGRLRARVTGAERSPIIYGSDFLLSPDGHWVVFPQYTWKAYHW